MLFGEETSGQNSYQDIFLRYSSSEVLVFHENIPKKNFPSCILIPNIYENEILLTHLVSCISEGEFQSLNNPDCFVLKPNEKGNILLENIKEVISFAGKSPLFGKRKVIVIHRACNLSISVSNALLKNLEEPSSNTFFLLIYSDLSLIISTIKSRSIIISYKENKANFDFIYDLWGLSLQNKDSIGKLISYKMGFLRLFLEEKSLEMVSEAQNLFALDFDLMKFRGFYKRYHLMTSFENLMFLILENVLKNAIERAPNNKNVYNLYFSFIYDKKYAKLYNTNVELLLYCTIYLICRNTL
jgi:hypothetical protein